MSRSSPPQRDLVPEIWLPDPRVRAEREPSRYRMHLAKHKSMLKARIHSTLITFGRPCPVTDLFGVAGRNLLGTGEPGDVADLRAAARRAGGLGCYSAKVAAKLRVVVVLATPRRGRHIRDRLDALEGHPLTGVSSRMPTASLP